MKLNEFKYPYNLAKVLLEDNIDSCYIKGLKEMLLQLSEREQTVIKLRFEELKTLQEASKIINVTRERVRQIEIKALRKLRQCQFTRNYIGISLSEHYKTLQEEKFGLENKYNEIIKNTQEAVDLGIKPPANVMLFDRCIEDLDLSVRSYNCLYRAGKRKIKEVAIMKLEDFLKVRNLGQKSINEIVEKLSNIGIKIADMVEEVTE